LPCGVKVKQLSSFSNCYVNRWGVPESAIEVGGHLAFGVDPGGQVVGRVVAEGGDTLVADAQQIALGKLAAPAVVLELTREGGKVDAGGLVAAAELFILD
jgi:hypothetical protein